MEALVAVGLAANVLQFVQAAGNIVSEASTIKKSGAPSDVFGLKERSEQLIKQASEIKSKLEASGAITTPEDQHLYDCAKGCESSGRQFTAYLETFITQRSSSNPLRHAQASIKFHWSHKKLEGFAEKLDQFRSALMLASILAFRSSADGYNRKVLAFLEQMKEDNLLHDVRLEDAVERVQKMTDLWQENGTKLDQVQEKLHEYMTAIYILKTESIQHREGVILSRLNFRQLVWRYEEIPLAYQTTYQWIFHPPKAEDGWDDFSTYLSGEAISKPYFINGKAGSGKSTLMKYIIDSPSTRRALLEWTGAIDLLVVDFFFWNVGTPMQKSHIGMLRAILYKVLVRYPDLVPAVFPTLYQAWTDAGEESNIEPTYAELKTALKLLIEKSSPFLRLCIVIDGIDEFEGDHKNMSEFLCSLASENLKVVVSSRPINACLNAFKGCPSLKLQDLTKHDMETFVRGNLTQNPSMLDLASQFPEESQEIIMEIRSRAEGVFLWVTLVVQLLIEGLENGDGLQDLYRKLRSLPTNLKELYERMFAKMTPEYRVQAAKVFQLFHAWNISTNSAPLMTLVLHFSNQGQEAAFKLPVSPLEEARFQWIERHTAAYIRSRCCGLIETYGSNKQPPGTHQYCLPRASKIGYLHRTVAEFLLDPEIAENIREQTKHLNFDPFLDLAIANLSLLKICEYFYDLDMFACTDRIFKFHKLATSSDVYGIEHYVDTVDRVRSMQRADYIQRGGEGALPLKVHWSEDLYRPQRTPNSSNYAKHTGDILSFAAIVGIAHFLDKRKDLASLPYSHRRALAFSALNGFSDDYRNLGDVNLQDKFQTLQLLVHYLIYGEGRECNQIDGPLWRRLYDISYQYGYDDSLKESGDALRAMVMASQPNDPDIEITRIIEPDHADLANDLHSRGYIAKSAIFEIDHHMDQEGGGVVPYSCGNRNLPKRGPPYKNPNKVNKSYRYRT